jgi:cation:H+ antiporter
MNIFWAFLFLAGGLLILWKAANLLVAGAVKLAERLGVSPLIIGLTIVAMGTSAPEVAASIAAVARGMGDTAIGNVFGSNIANLALVGGITALIRPIKIDRLTLRREIPVMILVALLLWPILHNLSLSRSEGILLLGVFAALILFTVLTAKGKEHKHVLSRTEGSKSPQKHLEASGIGKNLFFIIIGLANLALGADLAVRGAVVIGKQIGLSEAVIGLSIVAIGTSLPELATCVVAAIKDHHDISIGNLVGSNIFNTLMVTGTAGTIWPFAIGQRLMMVDYWIMIIVSIGFAALGIIGKRVIGRMFGIILLCGYIAYLIYLLAY